MKKKLEADLMSLAHKILKIKNKSDVHVLHQEAGRLYEKLSILAFLEENHSALNPTFSTEKLQQTVIDIFESSEIVIEEEVTVTAPVIENPIEEEILTNEEPITIIEEKVEEKLVEQEPEPIETPVVEKKPEEITTQTIAPVELNFDLNFPKKEVDNIVSKEAEHPKTTFTKHGSIDRFLDTINPMPTFVKADSKPVIEKEPAKTVVPETTTANSIDSNKSVSINDKLKKTVTIGLNDKIAFVKHLFDGNNTDFIRVVSQVNTLNSFEEAKDFIDLLVKPDHNNWIGKEEIEERFMHIIENKFS